jgi:SAM-dependent methyltransferase
MPFVSALDPSAAPQLRKLELQMLLYYQNPEYHVDWIRHANAGWRAGAHDGQLAAVERIPAGARLLEVGCGDTAAAAELLRRIPQLDYHGVDISIPVTRQPGLRLARAGGGALPFPAEQFDVVISMFTIEHTIHPDVFLDEAWRVLAPGGRLIIIAPDFLNNAMASERMGFGYGTGREKARSGKLIDAALTLYDSRIRLPAQRRRRAAELARGAYTFPILIDPRCLSHSGFLTDCDAIYPSCPEEITNYLQARYPGVQSELFFRDGSTFGAEFRKP